MKRSFLALLCSVVLATAGVAMTISVPSSANIEPSAETKPQHPAFQAISGKARKSSSATKQDCIRVPQHQSQCVTPILLKDRPPGSQTKQNQTVEALPLVMKAVLQEASHRTGIPISDLSVAEVKQETWSDGCLGLTKPGIVCTEALVPGWQITVASGDNRWVYRTNQSGTIVKWDEAASKTTNVDVGMNPPSPSPEKPPLRIVQRPEPTTPRTPGPSSGNEGTKIPTTGGSEAATQSKPGFSLTIRQPSGTLSYAIARVSLKAKGDGGYSQEKFVGDFKFKIGRRAQFVGGLPGDRVVVRLYDMKNHLIGLSEWEILPANEAVSLVLPDTPAQEGIVRTVYGIDDNQDGSIDKSTNVYDYFTKINTSTPGQEKVTFLQNLNKIDTSMFQATGLPKPANTSVYPTSFTLGSDAIVNQPMNVFSSDMGAVLTAKPGTISQVITVKPNNESSYQVNQLIAKNQEVPKNQNQVARVSFVDVPSDFWAKDFIAELADKGIIRGYKDRFRPNEPVTRGEFAAMLSLAFKKPNIRDAANFKDVTPDQWVHSYLEDAYQRGFFELEPGNVMNPAKKVTRLDVLVALARGLNYSSSHPSATVLKIYSDAAEIPRLYRNLVAAATEHGLVVNYPNVKLLKPNEVATRSEVAALIYQGMVSTGQAISISSPYVVAEQNKK